MISFSGHNPILGLSEISDGDMKITPEGDNRVAFLNRKNFLSRRGLSAADLVSVFLSHGTNLAIVGTEERGDTVYDCDGLITATPGVILSISVADCLPLYFFDPKRQVIALAHAGWKGVLAEIAPLVIKKMAQDFNCSPADIQVFIGPHLGQCHFGIQDDLVEKFFNYPECISRIGEKKYLDFAKALQRQLLAQGIKEENLAISSECTHCSTAKYFSYRRDRDPLRTMLAYLLLQ